MVKIKNITQMTILFGRINSGHINFKQNFDVRFSMYDARITNIEHRKPNIENTKPFPNPILADILPNLFRFFQRLLFLILGIPRFPNFSCIGKIRRFLLPFRSFQ